MLLQPRLLPLIDAAADLDELAAAAARIPGAAAAVVAAWQGEARAAHASAPRASLHGPADDPAHDASEVGALTTDISRLNDAVTQRVVQAVATETGVDLRDACWLTFGSQARAEQTLLTDQDNGLVFALPHDSTASSRRAAWQCFGQRVNEALARCGYPLCDGGVMAGQPLCCLSPDEWGRRFEHWMAHGDGNDLFAARIYFDLRPLAGNLALAQPLVDLLRSPAAAVPRFIKQMADIALCNHVPLNWLGHVVTTRRDGVAHFDLKMSGTALFVDAARLWALAHRLPETGTVPRLRAAARAMGVPQREAARWVAGFQTLQKLRLDTQRARLGEAGATSRAWVRWDELDSCARRDLEQALRAARLVQQRIALDYCR